MIHCHFCERKADPYYVVRFPGEAERGKEYRICPICQSARKDFLYCSPPLRVESGIPAEQRPRLLAIDFLQDNPYQPRLSMEDESLFQLAEIIESQGFQGVLEARPHPQQPGAYQLTAGHRRREAARLAGLIELPVIVRARSDREMAALAATENIQRDDLSPLEEGRLFQVMVDVLGMKQTEIADAIKKDRNYVRSRQRIAQAPEDIQAFIAMKEDSVRTVTYLLEIEDPAERAPIIEQLLKKTLTVNDLPGYIETMRRHKFAAAQAREVATPPAQTAGIEVLTQPSEVKLPVQPVAIEPLRQPLEVELPIQSAAIESLAQTSQMTEQPQRAVEMESAPSSGAFSGTALTLDDPTEIERDMLSSSAVQPAQARSGPSTRSEATLAAAHAAAQEQVRQRRLKSALSYLNQYQELISQQEQLSEKECILVRQILAIIQTLPLAS
ncbi:MAG TPA: ParB/RepB/Spo0J family partition protein [Ktedonosporobacter sp.]|nr:ParB/RepB/Spo0J family partition protein [Ktedonosporobacter sp.]